MQTGHDRAAARDLPRVLDRFRQVGEQPRHVLAGLEVVLGRQAAAVAVGQRDALRDARQHFVGVELVLAGEVGIVGGDDRQAVLGSKRQQAGFEGAFVGLAVALNFQIQPPVEQALHGLQVCGGARGAVHQVAAQRGPLHAVERDQPIGPGAEVGEVDRRLDAFTLKKALGDQRHQVFVTGLILRQQQQAVRVGGPGAGFVAGTVQPQHSTDHGLQPGISRGDREFERAEQIAPIGQRHRRHIQPGGELDQPFDRDRAIGQRIG